MLKQIPRSGPISLPFRVKVLVNFRMLLAMNHGEIMELFSLYEFLISYIQIILLIRTLGRNDSRYIP